MFFFVNLALFFNNYVNPVALDEISWKYYIVYCCWLSFELIVVYFVSCPRTLSSKPPVLTVKYSSSLKLATRLWKKSRSISMETRRALEVKPRQGSRSKRWRPSMRRVGLPATMKFWTRLPATSRIRRRFSRCMDCNGFQTEGVLTRCIRL